MPFANIRPFRASLIAIGLAAFVPAGLAAGQACIATSETYPDGVSTSIDIITLAPEETGSGFQPREGATVQCQHLSNGQPVGEMQQKQTNGSGVAVCDTEASEIPGQTTLRWTVEASNGCTAKSGEEEL